MSKTKELLSLLLDGIDDEYEMLELLRGTYEELCKTPLLIKATLTNLIEQSEETLVEKGLCPECGHRLEFEHDIDCDTYVPYGSTSGRFESGGHMVCPKCGWNDEG